MFAFTALPFTTNSATDCVSNSCPSFSPLWSCLSWSTYLQYCYRILERRVLVRINKGTNVSCAACKENGKAIHFSPWNLGHRLWHVLRLAYHHIPEFETPFTNLQRCWGNVAMFMHVFKKISFLKKEFHLWRYTWQHSELSLLHGKACIDGYLLITQDLRNIRHEMDALDSRSDLTEFEAKMASQTLVNKLWHRTGTAKVQSAVKHLISMLEKSEFCWPSSLLMARPQVKVEKLSLFYSSWHNDC